MQDLEDKLLEYLNGNLDQKESQEVENWVKFSDENRVLFDQVKQIYELSENDMSFEPDVEAAWNNVSSHINRAKAKQVYFEFKQWYRVAAVVMLGLSIGILSYISMQSEVRVIAANDEIIDVHLPDGTLIMLNKGAQIEFEESFDSEERVVKLEGQAFFDVHRDVSRPFEVIGSSTSVKVLGTSFDFLSEVGNSKVNVSSGKVSFSQIDKPDDGVLLIEDQQGILQGEKVILREGLDSESIAWRFEELVFKSTPLSEVILTLEKFYKVDITLSDNIGGCLISSSFKDKSLKEVLNILEAIAGIKGKEKDGVLELSGPGC